MTDVTSTINEHDEGVQSTSVVQVTDDKKADLHENLDASNVVDSMEFFMMSNEVTEKFRKEIQQANIASLKDVTMIDFSYRTNDRQHFSEFLGLNLALEKLLRNPEQKIILTSLIDIDIFLNYTNISEDKKDTLKLLLSKPNVKFLQVPYSLEQLGKVFENKEDIENVNNTEQSFQKIMEGEISRFLHDAKYWISLGSGDRITYEEQLPYLFNLAKDKKNDRWIAFEDKLISLLQLQHPSFKLLARENNLQWIVDMYKYSCTNVLPEGTRFEGVFVDWDGTLYDNKNLTFNQNIIDIIKDYEKQGKKITIRTGGNLEMKQKLLDEIGLHYTVENKTDYKGGTVEIAIDNDPQELLRANAKIKSEHHIKV